MFFLKSLLFVSAIGRITQVAGKTPVGFTPVTGSDLIVTYGEVVPQNGVEVAEDVVASQPSLATTSQLSGSSYAVIMIDLDIPVDTNPHTLFHWMQTDLTPATTPTTLTTDDTVRVFELLNTKDTPALVDYVSPAPPAANPLSHRYVQLLVDTSDLSTEDLEALKNAASKRVGFDVAEALAAAGVSDSHVVAGNSYNVTNSRPTQNSELKRAIPETRRMVVRAPEHWDAARKMRRQQEQATDEDSEVQQLPSVATKANSTVSVGVFERNGTIIVGVFPGNKSLPTNGTSPSNGTAPGSGPTVPVRGAAPSILPSSTGWSTGLVGCILSLMFLL